MPKSRQHRDFGIALRELRTTRGLSLKQVAAASRGIAVDTAGRISHPYLSQLEAGRARSVSLPKLLTLAGLYGVDVRDLLTEAAPAQRDRLRSELETWRAEGREIPTPIDRCVPPDKRKSVEQRLDKLLARQARSVGIPLEWEDAARSMSRWFVFSAASPAYPDRSGVDDLRLFWAGHLDFADRVRAQASANARTPWHDIVDRFESWLLYECGAVEELIGPVSSWTLDFATHLTACHFSERGDEQKYGFDGVPRTLVQGVRAYQLAHRLAIAAPSSIPSLSAPPDLRDAPRQYISDVVYPEPPRHEPCPAPPVPLVINTIHELAKRVSALIADARPEPSTLDAVVIFLERAGLGSPLPLQRSGSTPPKRRRQ